MIRPSRTRRFVSVLAGVALSAGAAPPAGAEETPFGFIATATAHGVRSTYFLPGQFVVEKIWDFGGPVAESRVDSSGGSAFASLPFPGEAALVGPGLVLNLAGLPSLPYTYPFYVAASHPASPKSEVTDPSGHYRLASEADPSQAIAEAFFRGGPDEAQAGRVETSTAITQSGDTIVAKAESLAQGLSFGGVLTIGSAVARSTTTQEPGQARERNSELVVNGAAVGGQPVGIGPDGVDDKALNDVLSNAGISVRIVRSDQTSTDQSSDVLEVRLDHPVPEGGQGGTISWRFGGATTSLIGGDTTGADPPASQAGDTGPGEDSSPASVRSAVPPPATPSLFPGRVTATVPRPTLRVRLTGSEASRTRPAPPAGDLASTEASAAASAVDQTFDAETSVPAPAGDAPATSGRVELAAPAATPALTGRLGGAATAGAGTDRYTWPAALLALSGLTLLGALAAWLRTGGRSNPWTTS